MGKRGAARHSSTSFSFSQKFHNYAWSRKTFNWWRWSKFQLLLAKPLDASFHGIYTRTVSSLLLFSFGTFDSFLFIWCGEKLSVYCKQKTHKLVYKSSGNQLLKTYCPNEYTVLPNKDWEAKKVTKALWVGHDTTWTWTKPVFKIVILKKILWWFHVPHNTVDGKGGLSNNVLVIFPSFVHILATKPMSKQSRALGQVSGGHWVEFRAEFWLFFSLNFQNSSNF